LINNFIILISFYFKKNQVDIRKICDQILRKTAQIISIEKYHEEVKNNSNQYQLKIFFSRHI